MGEFIRVSVSLQLRKYDAIFFLLAPTFYQIYDWSENHCTASALISGFGKSSYSSTRIVSVCQVIGLLVLKN